MKTFCILFYNSNVDILYDKKNDFFKNFVKIFSTLSRNHLKKVVRISNKMENFCAGNNTVYLPVKEENPLLRQYIKVIQKICAGISILI